MRSPRDLARSLSAVAVAILVVLALLFAVLAERSYAGRARRGVARPRIDGRLATPVWVGTARRTIARERRAGAAHARASAVALSDPPQPPPAPPAPRGADSLDSAGATAVS